MASSIYYRHSGKYSPVSLLPLFLAPILAGAILSAVYSALVFYNPFIYINFLGTLFLGLITGGVVARMGIIFKVRNFPITLLAGIVSGATTVYIAWIAYIYILTDFNYLAILPGDLIAVMQELAATGVWTISSFTPTGAALYLIWGIEAAIIAGATIVMSKSSLEDAAFCESCGMWAEDRRVVGPFEWIGEPKEFKAKIENGDYSELLELPKASNDMDFSIVEFIGVSKNPDFRLFTVTNISRSTDKDGKVKEERKAVAKNVISTLEINESIQALLEEPVAAIAGDNEASAEESAQ